MLILVIGHGLLLKKCTKFTDEFEPSANHLSTELKDITSILDEMCDMANGALQFVGNSPLAHPPSNPIESILTSLISNMATPKQHGSQESQNREIYEVIPPKNETENELD